MDLDSFSSLFFISFCVLAAARKKGRGLIMGNQKFRDAMMGLTLWGRGGHLRCAKEKHDLFGLVCGGVLVPSLACVVVKI